MIQTSRRLPGTLTGCPDCGRQPFHVHVRGPGKHFMECPPCELRTARFSTLQQAVAAWENLPREDHADAA